MARQSLKRIDQMYAFIALDQAENSEGVIAIQAGGIHLPLVGADMKMVEKLRPHAQRIAKSTGASVTLARFEIRTDLETIEGRGDDEDADPNEAA